MSKFEDRLWRDLVRKHGADLAQMNPPPAKRPRRRPRLLAGTTLSLAGIGAAVVLLVSAAGSSPAFAVSRNADGTVTVRIQRIEAIQGANAKLAALGIRARLVVVTAGCQVKALPPAAVEAMKLARSIAGRPAPQVAITRLDPSKIPPGNWQVIPTYGVAGKVHVDKAHLIAERAPVCLSFVAPPPCQPGNQRIARPAATTPAEAQKWAGGNSGNSGNSGTGSSGPRPQVPITTMFVGCYVHATPGHAPVTSNSGNSGNSGSSGNS